MSHDHTHHHDEHDHSHIPSNKKVLLFSFVLISLFMLVEFIGGFITNSLALISDAGHMLSDSVALGIALAAVYVGQKQRNAKKSFGYQRFEILAAALNGITLIAIALYIFIEAILRFQQPQDIQLSGMCNGQVKSDNAIERLWYFSSKELGDKYPSLECSRT